MIDDLYRSETLVVRRVAGTDPRRWIVTFDNHSIGPGFDRPGFGEAFLREEGHGALHILGRGNDWYQYADMPRALAAAAKFLRDAERIVTYGSSMGGYAAVRFARALGAHAAVALSPQYSNDLAVVPWERRWADDARRIGWRREWREAIDPCPQTLLIFDPRSDGRHAAMIAAEAPSILLPLAYAGHPVGVYLADRDLLRPLLRDVLADRLDADRWHRQARRGRSHNALYLGELAMQQPAHRSALAMTLVRRAHALAPGNVATLFALGMILSWAGEHREADAALVEAVRVTGRRDAVMLIGHSRVLLAAGRVRAAIALVDEALELLPGAHPHLFAWRATMAWQAGWRGTALADQWRAVRMAPRNREYGRALRRYWLRILRDLALAPVRLAFPARVRDRRKLVKPGRLG